MKLNKIFPIIAFSTLMFVACSPGSGTETETTIVTFEDVEIGSDGYTSFTFTTDGVTFHMNGAEFWEGGIACSLLTDTETAGYDNQYSVIAGKGSFDSKQFAVVYDTAYVSCPANSNGNFTVKSVEMTNNTYAYLSMRDGDMYAKKFAAGDWFKVIINGFLNDTKTGSVEYYLANFQNGNTFISKDWEKVDLSTLGEVDKLTFGFDSSDKGDWGVNTPKYVCIDNLQLAQEVVK